MFDSCPHSVVRVCFQEQAPRVEDVIARVAAALTKLSASPQDHHLAAIECHSHLSTKQKNSNTRNLRPVCLDDRGAERRKLIG